MKVNVNNLIEFVEDFQKYMASAFLFDEFRVPWDEFKKRLIEAVSSRNRMMRLDIEHYRFDVSFVVPEFGMITMRLQKGFTSKCLYSYLNAYSVQGGVLTI